MDSQWSESDSVQVILPLLLVIKTFIDALRVHVFGGATIFMRGLGLSIERPLDPANIMIVVRVYPLTEEVQVRFMQM